MGHAWCLRCRSATIVGMELRAVVPWSCLRLADPGRQGGAGTRALVERSMAEPADRRRRRASPSPPACPAARRGRGWCRRRTCRAARRSRPQAARRCCMRSRTSSSTPSTWRSTRSGALPACPTRYYRDWLRVAGEEALHFTLLREHLRDALGHDYGDFDAHDGLWTMVERTAARHRRPHGAGAAHARSARARRHAADAGQAGARPAIARAVEILDVILRDEVGHVAIGNRWYRWLCERDGLDPLRALRRAGAAPRSAAAAPAVQPRSATRAGFSDAELALLGRDTG